MREFFDGEPRAQPPARRTAPPEAASVCGIAGYAGTNRLDPRSVERDARADAPPRPDQPSHRALRAAPAAAPSSCCTRACRSSTSTRARTSRSRPARRGWRSTASSTTTSSSRDGARRDLRTELRHRGARAACSTRGGMEALDALRGHVGDRGLRRAPRARCCLRATASARSRSTCYRDGDGALVRLRAEVPRRARRPPPAGQPAPAPPLPRQRLQVALQVAARRSSRASRSCRAGGLLRIAADGAQRRRRYWEPLDRRPTRRCRSRRPSAGTRERLIRAVELRLRADVPLAFCMSGGVDSLSLISIARARARPRRPRLHDRQLRRALRGAGDGRPRRRRARRAPHRRPGSSTTRLPAAAARARPPPRRAGLHDHLLRALAADGGDPRHGYRVSVSGTPPTSSSPATTTTTCLPAPSAATTPGRARGVGGARQARWSRNPFLQDPDLFVERPGFRGHIYLDADEFAALADRPVRRAVRARTTSTRGLLRSRMLNELFTKSVPVILHEDDLNAMFFSIENRSPFLDRELFEHADRRSRRGCSSATAGRRRSCARRCAGSSPSACSTTAARSASTRRSSTCSTRADPAVRDELLADSPIFELVRREAVEALLDARELPNSRSKFLFNFICAKLFLEEFGDALMELRPNEPAAALHRRRKVDDQPRRRRRARARRAGDVRRRAGRSSTSCARRGATTRRRR